MEHMKNANVSKYQRLMSELFYDKFRPKIEIASQSESGAFLSAMDFNDLLTLYSLSIINKLV